MYKVLIGDNITSECVNILQAAGKIEVDVRPNLSSEELKGIIEDYDALIVRSGLKINDDIIGTAGKLQVMLSTLLDIEVDNKLDETVQDAWPNQ